MRQFPRRPAITVGVVVLLLVAVASSKSLVRIWRGDNPTNTHVKLPMLVLWAWERPEDLSSLPDPNTAIAFLAETIYLRGDQVVIRPRLQPLRSRSDQSLIPVVRIETDHPNLTSAQVEQIAHSISELGTRNVVAV